MNRMLTIAGLGVASILLSSNAFAQTPFEDGMFDLSNWSEYGPFVFPMNAGPGRMAPSQQMENGDYFLSFEIEGETVGMGETTSVWAILINDTAVFDPLDAAIRSIDFDFLMRRPPGAVGNRTVSLALEQDDFVWIALDRRVFTNPDDADNWIEFEIKDLSASDFSFHTWEQDDQPENPDFTETGSEIRFGVTTGTSCPTTSDCTFTQPSTVHIDDWRVVVFDVNDPIGGGGTGGTAGSGGTAGNPGSGGFDDSESSGCGGCRVQSHKSDSQLLFLLFLGAFTGLCLMRWRRRR